MNVNEPTKNQNTISLAGLEPTQILQNRKKLLVNRYQILMSIGLKN